MNLPPRLLKAPLRNSVIGICVGLWSVLLVAWLSGCGGGGGGGLGRGSQGQGTIPILTASGKVMLPSGTKIALSGLTVESGIDKEPVGAAGNFSVKVAGPGENPVFLTNSLGAVVMMGYADGGTSGSSPFGGGNGQISPLQTATMMIFESSGAFTAPTSSWEQVILMISSAPQTQTLANVIATRVAANPGGLFSGDPQITTALASADQALLPVGTGAAARLKMAGLKTDAPKAQKMQVEVSRTASGPPTVILLNDTNPESGVTVLNNGDGTISFMNEYRRRAAGMIYETGVQSPTDSTLQTITPKPIQLAMPAPLTALLAFNSLSGPPTGAMEIQPANALHGTVGSLVDVVFGNGAFTPVTTGPLALPQDGNAVKTVYTIVVLGPGSKSPISSFALASKPEFQPYVQDWTNLVLALTEEEAILDVVIPTVFSLPFPPGTTLKGVDVGLINDIANALAGVPDFYASLKRLDISGALNAFFQTLLDSGSFRDEFVQVLAADLLTSVSGELTSKTEQELEDAMKFLGYLVSIVDYILQCVDDFALAASADLSDQGNDWIGTVVQPKVSLSPPTATVDGFSGYVSLIASPSGNTTDDAPYIYSWSVSGSAGGSIDDNSHESGAKSFTDESGGVQYEESIQATQGSSDVVTVTVYENLGTATNPIIGERVGTSQSTVTVEFAPCPAVPPTILLTVRYTLQPPPAVSILSSLTISPVTVKATQTATVTAVVNGAFIAAVTKYGGGPPQYQYFGFDLGASYGGAAYVLSVDGQKPLISGTIAYAKLSGPPTGGETHTMTFNLSPIANQFTGPFCSGSSPYEYPHIIAGYAIGNPVSGIAAGGGVFFNIIPPGD